MFIVYTCCNDSEQAYIRATLTARVANRCTEHYGCLRLRFSRLSPSLRYISLSFHYRDVICLQGC